VFPPYKLEAMENQTGCSVSGHPDPVVPGEEHSRLGSRPVKKGPWRAFAAACIVAAGFCVLGAAYSIALQGTSPGKEGDFIGYWATGQQLLRHGSPYDIPALLQIERSEGYDRVGPSITPSPPAAYLLLLPLGLISAKVGLFLWGMAMLASLSISLRLLWILHGHPDTLLHLFGFLFAPVWVCILGGQLGIFFLLSIVLFLYFLESRPYIAGAVLLPCAMKPHLFLPFAFVVFLWMIHRKGYRVLAGFLIVLLASCLITLYFDSHIWSEYLRMLNLSDVKYRYTPNFSVILRDYVDRNAAWLQYVLGAAASVWAAWYYWTQRARWNWMDQGLLVLLISRLCAPYAWFSDESVILATVLTGAVRAKKSGYSLWPFGVVGAAALIEVHEAVDIKSPYYMWTTPAWLACYLYATMRKRSQEKGLPINSAHQAGQDVDPACL
jgi:glycosyl transferase family 87